MNSHISRIILKKINEPGLKKENFMKKRKGERVPNISGCIIRIGRDLKIFLNDNNFHG